MTNPRLFVASYEGVITTLELSTKSSGAKSLETIATCTNLGPHPSWLVMDAKRKLIWCTEAGMLTGNGTLWALSIQNDGSLLTVGSLSTLKGAAHAAIYGDNSSFAISYYHGGTVGTYNIQSPENPSAMQHLSWPFHNPGPDPAQTQNHPHAVVVDPTGEFVLVPDLGPDLVRIFHISKDPDSYNQLVGVEPLKLPRGSTPRHGEFVKTDHATFFYCLMQDINTLVGYRAEYLSNKTGLAFKELGTVDTLMRLDGSKTDRKVKSSHLLVTPDQRFIVVSTRNDWSFTIKAPVDRKTLIPSDAILTYKINHYTGKLDLVDFSNSGGLCPRQFSFNKTGSLMAVTVQLNGWLAIYERNVESGKVGPIVAVKNGLGQNVCAIWDEE